MRFNGLHLNRGYPPINYNINGKNFYMILVNWGKWERKYLKLNRSKSVATDDQLKIRCGAGEGTRTLDILLGRQELYH